MRTLLLTFALCAALRVQAAPAEFAVTKIAKAKDKVTAQVSDQRVVFNVVSSDGIGNFEAVLKSGQWPLEVSVLLNLKGLENFGLRTDSVQITGGAPRGVLTNCWAFTLDGRSIPIKAREAKDGLELIFPRSLFLDTKEFGFGWIDAYRR